MYGGDKETAEKETGLVYPSNVIFGGYIDNSIVPEKLNDINIMLLPNRKNQICNNEYIGEFTSPLKLFEYMASGRPIVASSIDVLKEVLNDNNSYLVDEDDENCWKKAIERIIDNTSEALEKAIRAKEDVKQYTGNIRANKMKDLLS